MKTGGILIPPWFEHHEPTCQDLAIVSIAWGMALCLTVFGLIRVCVQTYHQWKRAHRVTTYMVLIWLELVASSIIGGLAWGYVGGTIRPGFLIYFFLLFLWVFQIHCIMQIIVNRIALLAVSPTIVRRLKWGIFIVLALINISVFCVWIPARLQISQTYVRINNIWDRIEKGIFAVIDLALNFYFVYLVRSSLISYGLTKYVVLYRVNLVMVAISISMDLLIIGAMSLRNTFLYVEFHPLAYLVKLHIELSMAELIAKIVKASGPNLACHCICHNNPNRISMHQSLSRHSAPAATGLTAPTTGRFRRSWPAWSNKVIREKRHGRGRLSTSFSGPKRKSKPQTTWNSNTNTTKELGSQSVPTPVGKSNGSDHGHDD
ncbi:hypothetical protein F66182_5896 [Fusarium sp. NRRL 66182]|nr:hypothetical protein F66182_5896 [Fusarium sp. NRRL 66182]